MKPMRLVEAMRAAISSAWTLFLITFMVRLLVFAQVLPQRGPEGFYQFNEQARIAWSLASGHGFSSPWINTPLLPTAQQPPIYPMLLAGTFKLAGSYSKLSLWIAEILNATFAGLTAILIFSLGKQSFNSATATIAAWAWAIWQYPAVVAIRVWDSSLSALLLTFSLWWLSRLPGSSSWAKWLGFGVLVGVSGLTNPALLAVFPFFCLWLWVRQPGSKVRIAASLLACLLTLAPWVARNYAQFHRWIPVRDNFGFELWQGNHEGPKSDAGEYVRLGEIPYMEAKHHAAMEFIVHGPGAFVWRCGQRAYHFWSDPDPLLWLPVSALAWIGLVLSLWRKHEGAVPLAMVVLAFPGVYYITHPGAAYRHPMEPVVTLLSTYALVTIGTWVKKILSRESPAPAYN